MTKPQNIILVGCGKMGSALLHGWLQRNIDAQFSVIEPNDLPDILSNDLTSKSINHFHNIDDASDTLKQTDAIILAVKPQLIAGICNNLKQHTPKTALILSIAAGQSITTFENHFSSKQPIIRAMPNTPAAIGKAMSVAIANTATNAHQKNIARTLLESAGKLEWLDNEGLLNAVTALSGSGPAYVFHLIEILTQSGIECGLSQELSTKLARQTVIGSAALAEQAPEATAQTLRKNVTSPGGTTQAALNILMDGRAQKIFDETLKAATKRGRQLNN